LLAECTPTSINDPSNEQCYFDVPNVQANILSIIDGLGLGSCVLPSDSASSIVATEFQDATDPTQFGYEFQVQLCSTSALTAVSVDQPWHMHITFGT
jgi:hypothetical protein